MSRNRPLIEVLATSIGAVRAALQGGADRIELCENDPQGGTTPSLGTIEVSLDLAAEAGVPVNVMVRPRGGGFVFDADERAVMLSDARNAVERGAQGVVTGALTSEGEVDVELMRALVDAAGGLPVTFHRAIDITPDLFRAADRAYAAGCTRILTSGGAPRAIEGSAIIGQLVSESPAGFTVIAGGGLTPMSATELVERTGVTEIHVAARRYRVDGASPSPAGMVGVTAGPGPDWPVNGWPAPDSDVLAEFREQLR